MVMDMTNCHSVHRQTDRILTADKGIYEVDLDDAWFELPAGPVRDILFANPSYMLCVYHRKTRASLFDARDLSVRKSKCDIVIKAGGYAHWKKIHAHVVKPL